MSVSPLFTPGDAGERIPLPALGIAMRVLVPAAASGGRLAMIEETTDPGRGPPLHIHHQQIEIFRFIEGEYELLVGEERMRAGPGASAVVPAGMPHTFRNVGTAPARLVFILTPAEAGEAFFRELATLTTDGMPDPATLAAFGRRFDFEIVGPPLGG